MDEYVPYIAGLAIDGLIFLFCAKQYCAARKLFSTFTKSVENGINCYDKDDKDAQYAVVRGQVKSMGPPIKSLNKSFTSGVIQRLMVKEFYTEKAGVALWVNRKEIVDDKLNVVPFQLQDGKFKIDISSPLDAEFLNLEVIEDNFESFSSTFLGFLFGVQKQGIQHTEYMLKEKSILTGFGEIQAKNGTLTLIPPRNGMSYILTTMDTETITNRLSSRKDFYCVLCVFCGVVGVTIASVLTYKYWKARSDRRRLERLNELAQRAQIERRRNTSTKTPIDVEFTCIVCYIRPRETVLLPCGHISLCADCALRFINDPCPICRQPVTDTNFIYIS